MGKSPGDGCALAGVVSLFDSFLVRLLSLVLIPVFALFVGLRGRGGDSKGFAVFKTNGTITNIRAIITMNCFRLSSPSFSISCVGCIEELGAGKDQPLWKTDVRKCCDNLD